MFRPVTHLKINKGKPVEALTLVFNEFYLGDVGRVLSVDHSNGVQRFDLFDKVERLNFINELCFLKAQAVNPPIKVTQAVLDAMEKVPEAKFLVTWGGLQTWYESTLAHSFVNEEGEEETFNLISLGKIVIADCPLALQVLLGFTIEGVPKDA
jgi:hypothetical protein